jgi:hypothetical protein
VKCDRKTASIPVGCARVVRLWTKSHWRGDVGEWTHFGVAMQYVENEGLGEKPVDKHLSPGFTAPTTATISSFILNN